MLNMDQRRLRFAAIALLLASAGLPGVALGQNVVSFSPTAAGVTKSVAEWGVDTAWPSFDNVRQSVAHIGQANVDVVRLNFYPDQALVTNTDGTYSLNSTARGYINTQLSLAGLAGANKPLSLLPTVGTTHSMYMTSATEINVDNWARMIKATQEYINSRPGFTTARFAAIEPFNEPDYWSGQGTPANLNSVIGKLKSYAVFQDTAMVAASTLSSDSARYWYDRVPAATQGSSHLLGGSMTSYVNFMKHVKNTGKAFANPELHSLGEAIVGAEHGMVSGTWWADVLRARGLFVQTSDGKRLGYAENLDRQSAAAVYRGPDGKIRAFAGGVERFGKATAYRFVSDQDVYFNGIPVREYMLQTKWDETDNATAAGGDDFQNFGSWSNQGAYADVDLDGSGVPALDGYRWKIVNATTGQVMEVAGGGTNDGAAIRSASDAGGLNQMWNIVRTRNGYYQLYNANSGRTAEVTNGSLNNGAAVRQWGTADNMIQHWYIEEAGNGAFYLRNGHSNKYLTSGTSSSSQGDLNASAQQKWKFVLANPVVAAKTRLEFAGNASSSTGVNNGTAVGTPQYAAGPSGFGQAIQMSGDDYVQLPAGSASSTDITIATWVKWDGGAAWQRIFDFGNNTTSYMFLSPQSGAGTMRFAITTTGNEGEQILDTSPLPVGEWTHLTLTLGGNTGILYVNGTPRVAGQILLNPSDVNATLNYLGKSQWPDPLFRGMLDDFRIYDYALDASQVGSLVPHAWKVDANGTWLTASNWTYDAAPNGAGHSASFSGPYTAPRTVTIGSPISLGALAFDSSHGLTISGASPLTFDALFGPAKIDVVAGHHSISVPVRFADDVALSVAAGASIEMTHTLDGANRLLVKTGAGTARVAQLRRAGLDLQAGTVQIVGASTGSSTSGTSSVLSLAIAAGAVLDLSNNALAIDYSGSSAGALAGQIRQYLLEGRLIGSDPGDASLAVGYADNAILQRSMLNDLPIDSSTLILELCLKGDTNLDGTVDFADLLSLAQHYSLPSGAIWTQGDSNYDGAVDFGDLLSLAQNYSRSVTGSFESDWTMAKSLAPEPASAGVVALLAAVRRSRSRSC